MIPNSEKDSTTEQIANAICDYILEFDRELKLYCAGSDSLIKTQVKLEWEYQNHIKKSLII